MLARRYRLSRRQDVTRLYSKGRSARSRGLSIKYLPNRLEHNRFAVVVSKKTAKSAPLRNRIRRRLFALLEDKIKQPDAHFDAIISIFDADVAVMSHVQLQNELDGLLSKVGIKS